MDAAGRCRHVDRGSPESNERLSARISRRVSKHQASSKFWHSGIPGEGDSRVRAEWLEQFTRDVGYSSCMNFERITIEAGKMGGMPCIRGLRIPVATVVGLFAEGATESEILGDYPDLEPEDLREALRFAAEALRERQIPALEPK